MDNFGQGGNIAGYLALLGVIFTQLIPLIQKLIDAWRSRGKDKAETRGINANSDDVITGAAGKIIHTSGELLDQYKSFYDKQLAECNEKIDILTAERNDMKLTIEHVVGQYNDISEKYNELNDKFEAQGIILQNVQREFVKVREKYDHEHRRAETYRNTLSQHRIDIPTIK